MELALVLLRHLDRLDGMCSLILSDKRRVVRPMYDAPHEHSNEYTQKLVVKHGRVSLSCVRITGLDLKLTQSWAAG